MTNFLKGKLTNFQPFLQIFEWTKIESKKKDQGITVEKCNNLDFNSGKNCIISKIDVFFPHILKKEIIFFLLQNVQRTRRYEEDWNSIAIKFCNMTLPIKCSLQ